MLHREPDVTQLAEKVEGTSFATTYNNKGAVSVEVVVSFLENIIKI
jgi:hypothetical protein